MVMARAGQYGSIIKKLQQQAAGNFGVDDEGQPIQRAPVGYGVFASGLAGALQQGAQDPLYGGADALALSNYANMERASAGATSDADRKAALYGIILQHPELLKDARGLSHLEDAYGLFNPTTTAADAAIDRNVTIAGRNKTQGEAYKAMRDAGITPTQEAISQDFGNPVTGTPETGYNLFQGNITPDEQARLTTAKAAQTNAEANMIDAKNPNKYNHKTGGSSGQDTYTYPIIVQTPNGPMMGNVRTHSNPNQGGASANAGPTNDAQSTAVQQGVSRYGFQMIGHNSNGDPVLQKGNIKGWVDKNGKFHQG